MQLSLRLFKFLLPVSIFSVSSFLNSYLIHLFLVIQFFHIVSCEGHNKFLLMVTIKLLFPYLIIKYHLNSTLAAYNTRLFFFVINPILSIPSACRHDTHTRPHYKRPINSKTGFSERRIKIQI